MRKWIDFYLKEKNKFTSQLLKWGNSKDNFIVLNGNSGLVDKQTYRNYDLIAAAGAIEQISCNSTSCFEQLRSFSKKNDDWLFGYFSYDLKNELEDLKSENFDGLGFPELYFFIPEYIFLVKDDKLDIGYLSHLTCSTTVAPIFYEIETFVQENNNTDYQKNEINNRISKQEYLSIVEKLQKHILKGDIYEANFCQEFYAENSKINPLEIYQRLNSVSPTPFSAYLKNNNNYLMSASPERFLTKRGEKIISQPIKGTAKRGNNPGEDEKLKLELETNEKERAENIMIVDLVRNDLSKTAKKGSVEVEELCKIYSFEQVHQMISTVGAKIDSEKFDIIDVIKNAFPMGSMTGTPKIRALELIEKYEKTKRGLYSGAVGYISPDKDFDFNVVIRSILYNEKNKYFSYIVGSAITFKSDAEMEYDECLLKAKAMRKVLETGHN
ncbi:MAG: anthranilate synthase component I family protein [Bacteroidota bacterium]